MVKKILLSLYIYVIIIILSTVTIFFVFQDSKVYAQSNQPTCDTCNATPEQLLKYRDLVIYVLKSMPTKPKIDFDAITGSYASVIFQSAIKYLGDQSDQLFEVGVETIRKDVVKDLGSDFLQNLFTSFRSNVYIRDNAKMKILDDMINNKANQIIIDGRRDDNIPTQDIEKIKSYMLNSKIFADVDIKYGGYADMIKFLYKLNQNIKTWISIGTTLHTVGTDNIVATFEKDWVGGLDQSYDCVRGSFACNNQGKSFVSGLNGVGKKITSNRKSFTKSIKSSSKKLKELKFKGYFKDTKLVKSNIDVENPFYDMKKDIQDAKILKKQVYDILGDYSIEDDRPLPCLGDNGANLNEKDASLLRSICNNMINGVHDIVQSTEKADIYGIISDPRTTTKLFIGLSQKVDLARGDNKGGVAGIVSEVTELCTTVCSNLNDNITCSS